MKVEKYTEIDMTHLTKDIPYPKPEIRWCLKDEDGTWHVFGFPTEEDVRNYLEEQNVILSKETCDN